MPFAARPARPSKATGYPTTPLAGLGDSRFTNAVAARTLASSAAGDEPKVAA
jgi:hypothetical protein